MSRRPQWAGAGRLLQDARAGWLSLPAGIVAWEIAGRVSDFAFLPPFSAAVTAVWRMTWSGELPLNLLASLTALLAGYSAAVCAGIPLGLVMGRYRRVDAFLDAYITILLATPKLLFVPVLFGIFGTSRLTQVIFIFLSAVVIITVNARSGVRGVDAGCVEMARSFGATERQVLARVLLPGALPLVMAGVRMGMGRGVRAMVMGDMLIAVVGVGALLRKYGGRFDAASVFGLLLVVVGVALACTWTIRSVERRMTRWTEEA
ncbi:MAG TPA: ABC transporter permease subunit [Vicinamibacterales bacterium]|nr:ABC transporter permease subunit [Vicinamibacterales bacterium]